VSVAGSALLDGGLTVVPLGGAGATDGMQLNVLTTNGGLDVGALELSAPSGYTMRASGGILSIGFSLCTSGICWDGGAGTAFWTDAANWTGDALPGLNDLVFIALDSGSSVVLNGGTHSIAGLTTTAGNNLTIGGGSLTLTGTVTGSDGLVSSVLAGDLTLTGSGTLSANGRLEAPRFTQTGGTFNGAGDLFVSTEFSQTGGSHTGSGRTVLGNAITFAPGNYAFNRDFEIDGTLKHDAGTLTIAAGRTVMVDGTLDWTGESTIAGPGSLSMRAGATLNIGAIGGAGGRVLDGVTVNNAGSASYSGGSGGQLLLTGGSTIRNTGTFELDDNSFVAGDDGRFENAAGGTLLKNTGSGDAGFGGQIELANLAGGLIDVRAGRLVTQVMSANAGEIRLAAGSGFVLGGGTLVNAAGGLISGSGSLFAGGGLRNEGTLRPGGNGSIGTLTIAGALTQTDTGRIEAELQSGGALDRIDVSGTTLLDGVLQVTTLGGYTPADGTALDIVSAPSVENRGLTLDAPAGSNLRLAPGAMQVLFLNCSGVCWDGGAGTSDWLNADNWTGDVLPGLNDLVFITLAGGANVTLNAVPPVTVKGLTIGRDSALDLTGGTLNAPTTVQSGGTLTLSGGTLAFGPSLTNSGMINYGGGTMSGNVFTNNGTLNVGSGSAGNLTTTRLDNNGSIIVDTDTTFEFGSGGGMILANNGSVDVLSGTLSVLAHDTDLSGPGADSGAYTVASDATLRFRDAFRDFGPGSSITGPGDVEFTAFSGGIFNVNGGYNVSGKTRISGNTLVNFNRDATFGDLRVAGNIGGNGALTVANDLTWTAGSIGGSGRVIVVRGDTVLDGSNLALNGAVLNIGGSGRLDTDTQLALNSGSQLVVSDGASLGLGSNTSVGGTGSLVNRGTLEGTLGGGTSNVGVRLINDGNVQASAGNLGLTGGIGGGGSFVIGDDATMELGGDLPPDIFSRIGGAGTLSFAPGAVTVINQTFAARAGEPLGFSLRSGSTLTTPPTRGEISGADSGWTYLARSTTSGADTARFSLTLGAGTASIFVTFNVTPEVVVTPPVAVEVIKPLLRETVQPPKIDPPQPPKIDSPRPLASVDALSDIVTASGTQIEQPLRDFRASRLQCR